MMPKPSLLDDLKRATEAAAAANNDFRRAIAQRIASGQGFESDTAETDVVDF